MADVDCTLSKGLEEIKDKISFLHDLWGIDVDEEESVHSIPICPLPLATRSDHVDRLMTG
jgi:hypothetical protein